MMVSMGLYDQLIHSITHLFSNFKKSIRFLLPIFLGAGLGIVILAKVFEFLLERFPVATNLGFCGLILGSLPFLFQHVKGKKIRLSDALSFLVFFAFIVILAFVKEPAETDTVLALNTVTVVQLFFVGVIAAATMVIPGVSGSMILMLLGFYGPVLNLVSSSIDALIHFDLPLLWNNILLCLPFGLGVILGIFGIAKLIEWIMKRWKRQTHWAIIGLICASPIAILVQCDYTAVSVLQYICGVLALIAGVGAALLLGEQSE